METKDLKLWDSIRILSIPKLDLEQREREYKKEYDDYEMLPTETVIEKIIEQRPVVIIDEIDEDWKPWFWCRIKTDRWNESHSLALMENDSWELVYSESSTEEEPKEHKVAKVEKSIDEILEEYEEEYMNLAIKSEKLHDKSDQLEQESKDLENEYKWLDRKTWLNALFEELAELKK